MTIQPTDTLGWFSFMLIKRVPMSLGISHTVCITLFLHALRESLTFICLVRLTDNVLLLWLFLWPSHLHINNLGLLSVGLQPECIYQSWLLSLWTSYCVNVLTWSMNRAVAFLHLASKSHLHSFTSTMLKSLRKNLEQETQVGLHESKHFGDSSVLISVMFYNLVLMIHNDKCSDLILPWLMI